MNARFLIASLSLLTLAHTAHATIILTDDFTVDGVTDNSDLNYNLANRQTGSAIDLGYITEWARTNSTVSDTQVGNTNTNAGQAGGATESNYLLVAYYGGATNQTLFDDELTQGEPLTIDFDMSSVLPPNATDASNWLAFRFGDYGNTWPVVAADAPGFAFLYRINGEFQIFHSGINEALAASQLGNHFTLVFSDTAGTGSPFLGNGTQVKLYNESTLLGTWDVVQMSSGFVNFRANGAFGAVDNLVVKTGLPDFSAPADLKITSSTFNFSSSTLNLSWTSQAGKTYQVTQSSSLASGSWTAVGSPVTAAGAEATTSVSFVKGNAGFFRVEETVPTP